MFKLQEILTLGVTVQGIVKLFGCTQEFEAEYFRQYQLLGKVIAEESGITLDEAMGLDPETELGPKAQASFQDLKTWLACQHPAFA